MGMESFGSRLKSRQKGLSVRAFAKQLGVSDAMVKDYFNGISHPRPRTLERLARAAGVHVEWLATGEGPRDIPPASAISSDEVREEHVGRSLQQAAALADDDEDAIALPRLSVEGSAGQGLVPTREEIEDYLSISRRYLREVGVNPMAAHVLHLSGHSMSPTLLDKDLVIVDTSKNRLQDEEVYSVVFGDTVLIKRLSPLWDGSIRVTSDNKNGYYPDAIIPAAERGQLRIIGRVCGYLRLY